MQPDSKYNLARILSQFDIEGKPGDIAAHGSGHINQTFLVKNMMKGAPDYILQKINNKAFPDIPALMYNMSKVVTHLKNAMRTKGPHRAGGSGPLAVNTQAPVVELMETKEGNSYHKDPDGTFWRMMIFIRDAITYDRIDDAELAFQAGKAIGSFQRRLADIEDDLLVTLPGFHDYRRRFDAFLEANKNASQARRSAACSEVDFIMSHADRMETFYASLTDSGIPQRITHNDTKVNNILYDSTGKSICLIDLDTVMPGYIHYDYGDALRTLASSAEEDEPDLEKVSFDLGLFKAFSRGYLLEVQGFISSGEAALLPMAPQYMTYIIGLRFLTDYLADDIYFRVHKPNHNLIRARAQFKLLRDMDNKQGQIAEVISNCL